MLSEEGGDPGGGSGRLRVAVAPQGPTLIALAPFASPPKRRADPTAVQVPGPVDDAAFLFLRPLLVEVLGAQAIGSREAPTLSSATRHAPAPGGLTVNTGAVSVSP